MGLVHKTDIVKDLVHLINVNKEIIIEKYFSISNERVFAVGDVMDVPI